MKPEGLRLHANLILESAFYPSLSEDFQCRLIMRDTVKNSPENFLLSLRKVVDEIELKEGDFVEVGRLKRDIYRSALILADEKTLLQHKRVEEATKQALYSSVAAAAASSSSPQPQREDPRRKAKSDDCAKDESATSSTPSKGGQSKDGAASAKKPFLSRDKDRDSSTRKPAQEQAVSSPLKFRAHGTEIMELDLMDSVLCCIYLVMTLDDKGSELHYPNRIERTHRCVVDSITNIGGLAMFGAEFNSMSKTKIRSVTGVLKSCGALVPTSLGDENSPCLLILSKSLTSFEECRAAVDAYMLEDSIVAIQPKDKKDQYMWTQRNMESRRLRAAEVLGMVREPMKAFLRSFVEPPMISPTKGQNLQQEKSAKAEREAWSAGVHAAANQGRADIDFLASLDAIISTQSGETLKVDTARAPPGFDMGPPSSSPTTTDEAGASPLGVGDMLTKVEMMTLPAYSLWGSNDDECDCEKEDKVVTATSIFGSNLIGRQ
jgi:hypothetical protein